jgi:hypothetical protein
MSCIRVLSNTPLLVEGSETIWDMLNCEYNLTGLKRQCCLVAIVTCCQINNELVSHYVEPVLVKLDPTSRENSPLLVSVCCDGVTLHAE